MGGHVSWEGGGGRLGGLGGGWVRSGGGGWVGEMG